MAGKATAAADKAAAETPETPAPATEAVDPRAAALAALTGGAAETPKAAEPQTEISTDDAEDFGGRTLAVVVSSRYNAKVNGEFRQARKGAVVKVTAEKLKRGVEIGTLRAVDGK